MNTIFSKDRSRINILSFSIRVLYDYFGQDKDMQSRASSSSLILKL